LVGAKEEFFAVSKDIWLFGIDITDAFGVVEPIPDEGLRDELIKLIVEQEIKLIRQ